VGVHPLRNGALSKLPNGTWRPFAAPRRTVLAVGMMAPAAWLLTGCGAGGADLFSAVALPSQLTTGYADGSEMPMTADAGRLSGRPELTPAQKDYLGALAAAGIHPSSDLRALSIGAYVCQARAAGQSDQTVWDSVAPMVRSDVVVSPVPQPQSAAPEALPAAATSDDNAVVGNVIRIATGRLC
jgi:hypothetical protein